MLTMSEPEAEKYTKPDGDPELGARIRAARDRIGWTRKEAAERAGVGDQYLYRIEQGRQGTSLDKIHALALAWGVDPSEMDDRLAGRAIRSTPGGCSETLTLAVEARQDGTLGLVPATAADAACLRAAGVHASQIAGEEAWAKLARQGVRAVLLRLNPGP